VFYFLAVFALQAGMQLAAAARFCIIAPLFVAFNLLEKQGTGPCVHPCAEES